MKKVFSAVLALALCLGLCVPALAAPAVAMPTNDKLTVDGVAQNPTVYKIGGSNYFKIRDLAAILNGTSKQFGVGYDSAAKSVTATTGQGYAKLDSDLTGPPAGGNRTAVPSNDTIYVDGAPIQAEVYKIDGSNYFKLRDLGNALGFSVDWSAGQGMVVSTGGGKTTKAIEVTTMTSQFGTGWYVGDNGFGTGKLNNGKPITEDNVVELLAEAQKLWPTGIPWKERATYGNNWYEWSGDIVDNLLHSNGYNISSNYACGGFASMLSDYVFGLEGNPFHRVTDSTKAKPGDIIAQFTNDGTLTHVAFVANTVKSGEFAGCVWTTDGNYSDGTLAWPNYEYGGPMSEAISQFLGGGHWEVWSRYPER